jgi:hypothetical protein
VRTLFRLDLFVDSFNVRIEGRTELKSGLNEPRFYISCLIMCTLNVHIEGLISS